MSRRDRSPLAQLRETSGCTSRAGRVSAIGRGSPKKLALRLLERAYGGPQSSGLVVDSLAWRGLLELASEHLVLAPLADFVLREIDVNRLPIAAILRHYRDRAVDENDCRRRVLADSVAVLAKGGIACLALKGAAFLIEEVADYGRLRHMVDLDLLVHPAQLHRAFELLEATGYVRLSDGDAIHLHHAPPLADPGSVTAIELHERLATGRSNPISTADLFASARPGASEHATGLVPCPEHRVVHLISHAMLANKGARLLRFTLRDVVDLLELQRRHDIEWSAVAKAFAKIGRHEHAAGFLSAVERLLPGTFQAPVWAADGRHWAERAVEAYFCPQRFRTWRYWGQLICDIEAFLEHPEYRHHAVATLLRPEKLRRSARRYTALL